MSAAPRAYPSARARERTLADGRKVLIRPIREDDGPAERAFLERLSAEAKRMRFMKFVGAVNEQLVEFYIHVDYDRRMAFVCEAQAAGSAKIVGEARYGANPDGRSCEFGVVIADDWRKSGIAGLLMQALIDFARERGFQTMEGLVLRENRGMLKFVRALGFDCAVMEEDRTLVRVVKTLRPLSGAS
jgi:acetyltransferase